MQHDTRGSSESYHHISLLVADKGGARVRRVLRSEVVASSGKFINLRQVSCEAVIAPGRTYTVFVSTYRQAVLVVVPRASHTPGASPIPKHAIVGGRQYTR